MRGLYAIVDTDALARRGIDPIAFAIDVVAARPAALQLRDKRGGARRTLALLRALRGPTADAGVPLICNDRPDLAALADCDGVHLGQRDVPPSVARTVFAALGKPDPLIGMSVHDDDELSSALTEQPDYLAFGPVFGTRNKAQPEPTIGLRGLKALCERARRHSDVPLVAIGGIDAARAADVSALCDAVAVIGALLASGNAARDASAMSALVGGGS